MTGIVNNESKNQVRELREVKIRGEVVRGFQISK